MNYAVRTERVKTEKYVDLLADYGTGDDVFVASLGSTAFMLSLLTISPTRDFLDRFRRCSKCNAQCPGAVHTFLTNQDASSCCNDVNTSTPRKRG